MIQKLCNYPTCSEKTPRRIPYCPQHTNESYLRNKIYDKTKRNEKTKRFYKSKEWKRLRESFLIEKHYLCESCFQPANTVHHIVEVSEDWSKRLDRDNLMSVCAACHNKIHKK